MLSARPWSVFTTPVQIEIEIQSSMACIGSLKARRCKPKLSKFQKEFRIRWTLAAICRARLYPAIERFAAAVHAFPTSVLPFLAALYTFCMTCTAYLGLCWPYKCKFALGQLHCLQLWLVSQHTESSSGWSARNAEKSILQSQQAISPKQNILTSLVFAFQ